MSVAALADADEPTHPLTKVLDLWIPKCKRLHLLTQLTQLALGDLFTLHHDPLFLPARLHAFLLTRQQETQALALGLVPRRTTDTMDVHIDVFRAVELDDPVYRGEIEAAGRNIGAD